MKVIKGKRVLILGANSDIAEALASDLAKMGNSLILAGRNQEKLSALASDLIIRYEVPVSVELFDALDIASHKDFYKKIGESPDIVICSFGYLGDQELGENDWGEANKIISTNFLGAVSILNIVASDQVKAKDRTIVGISSVAGDRGRGSNYLYGSAKAGFTAYLSGLRNKLYSKGTHVVTVKPGFVKTKMIEGIDTPNALTATPEKVSKAIIKAVTRNQNVVYVLRRWSLVMFIIKHIPEILFKKLSL
ncbi:MAG: SDR family oxidoreductase [Bacteroidota bacterium]